MYRALREIFFGERHICIYIVVSHEQNSLFPIYPLHIVTTFAMAVFMFVGKRFEEGWEKVRQEILISLICCKLKKGKIAEVIAEELEEEVALVEVICEAAKPFAPEYDTQKIYEAFRKRLIWIYTLKLNAYDGNITKHAPYLQDIASHTLDKIRIGTIKETKCYVIDNNLCRNLQSKRSITECLSVHCYSMR